MSYTACDELQSFRSEASEIKSEPFYAVSRSLCVRFGVFSCSDNMIMMVAMVIIHTFANYSTVGDIKLESPYKI